jgi:predicted nucleotidyltransferase
MILKNTKLRNSLKKIIKDSEVEDIILFGSVVRGKDRPNDIDILVIFKKKVDKNLEYKIRKELEKYWKNISIVSKTVKTVIEGSFAARESVLFEGRSLISKDNLAEKYGFDSLGMFKYNFSGWDKLQKTKFYYALNGRNSEGIVNKYDLIKLSDNILLSPLDKIEKVKEFLDSWKLKYLYVPMLIPRRLNKKRILG